LLLSEQLDEQAKKDCFALKRMREDEQVWGALQRIVAVTEKDIIRQWTDDTTGQKSKKWLKGSLDTLRAFLPAIEQKVQDAMQVVEENVEAAAMTRSRADDGHGSGDLAIG
jgi:hypothetical protein